MASAENPAITRVPRRRFVVVESDTEFEASRGEPESWTERGIATLLVTLALLFSWLSIADIDPAAWLADAPQLCWVQQSFGVECPWCGMGEACVWWMGREPAKALAAHPFSAAFLWGVAGWVLWRVGSRRWHWPKLPRHWEYRVAGGFLASLLLWWAGFRLLWGG